MSDKTTHLPAIGCLVGAYMHVTEHCQVKVANNYWAGNPMGALSLTHGWNEATIVGGCDRGVSHKPRSWVIQDRSVVFVAGSYNQQTTAKLSTRKQSAHYQANMCGVF